MGAVSSVRFAHYKLPRIRYQYRRLSAGVRPASSSDLRIERPISKAYKDAGVDIAAGNALVDAIKPLARATSRPGADGDLGGFGGLFDLKALDYRDPLLVSATDGVGTKLKLAIDCGRHDTIGIDLVAMCVNDLAVHGAEPLFFLDYFATAQLDAAVARSVIAGIADGCKSAECALIGGETAEMPGLYRAGDYDLAGFAVGIVERENLLPDRAAISPGDMVLGLASDGVHANGFALVRRVLEKTGADLGEPAPFASSIPLADALLCPTRIYVSACARARHAVKAFAHITGGGIVENLERVLPAGTRARIDGARWPSQPVFRWLQRSGGIDPAEMFRTFNCGIGMAIIAAPNAAAELREQLNAAGETVHVIGEIVAGAEPPTVVVQDMDAPWRA